MNIWWREKPVLCAHMKEAIGLTCEPLGDWGETPRFSWQCSPGTEDLFGVLKSSVAKLPSGAMQVPPPAMRWGGSRGPPQGTQSWRREPALALWDSFTETYKTNSPACLQNNWVKWTSRGLSNFLVKPRPLVFTCWGEHEHQETNHFYICPL